MDLLDVVSGTLSGTGLERCFETHFFWFDRWYACLTTVYCIQENVCGGKLFVVFHSTTNLFLQIMALSISNISLQNCYSKSFTVNSYFQLKPWKFSPIDVFPCTVYEKSPKKWHEFEEVISDLQQYVFIRWCCNKTYLCKWFQMGLTHIKWHETATVEIWCML